MHRLRRLGWLAAFLSVIATPASAQQIYNNWNTAACATTDVATITVAQTVHVRRIDIWFRWRPNERSVGYTASLGNETVAEGEMVRADCDPIQASWCIARVEPNTELEPGTYTFRTARAGICQNAGSGGQGFIRIFGAN